MQGPGLVLELLVAGCQLDLLACSSCREQGTLARTLAFVERILGALGHADLTARLRPAETGEPKVPPTGSRRDPDQLVATIEQPHSLKLREPMATNNALASILARRSQCQSQGMIVDDDAPGGIVLFNRRSCTYCGACAIACPIGAINVSASGRLTVDAISCFACGRCVLACPEHAITVRRGVDIDRLNLGACGSCASPSDQTATTQAGADPMLASVLSRLAGKGANAALLSGLRRNTG
jgi:ferredoxin